MQISEERLASIIKDAHMAGQSDAGVDPSWSNAIVYAQKKTSEQCQVDLAALEQHATEQRDMLDVGVIDMQFFPPFRFKNTMLREDIAPYDGGKIFITPKP